MLANEMMRPAFWLAALQIMGINILLSGDNAVVIALAVRALPPRERFWGMVLGAGCAAVLLILFTGIVATLLKLPYLKLIGGLAHTLRRIRITEIAAERCHFTARVFHLYLDGNVGERHLIARDEQQIDTMRGKLASTQPT